MTSNKFKNITWVTWMQSDNGLTYYDNIDYRCNAWVWRKNTGQGMPLHKVKLERNSFILLR